MSLSNFHMHSHLTSGQHIRHNPRATSHSPEDALQLSVKQYIPRNNPDPKPGDITIIAAGANGFPKELYEPLWDELLARSEDKHSGFKIRGIWIADLAQQGASGLLNADLLGDDPSWYDHPFDLLHLINTHRAAIPQPILGLGHSIGGNQLAYLSLIHPRLFTGIVMLDAMIQPEREQMADMVVNMTVRRRDVWPSRAEAKAAFERSPFYQGWDSRVLERWIQYGLRDVQPNELPSQKAANPTTQDPAPPPVTLTTPKTQELFTFSRPSPNPPHHMTRPEIFRLQSLLPHLPTPILFLRGTKSAMLPREAHDAHVVLAGTDEGGSGGAKAEKVVGREVAGVGHLMAMEEPRLVAETCKDWIGGLVGEWWRERNAVEEEWGGRIGRDRAQLGPFWPDRVRAKM